MNHFFKDCFFIKKNGSYQRISLRDILYLEANGDYINIFIAHKNQYLVRNTLSKVEALLPAARFLRIHRSYIVQLQTIESINFTEGTLVVDGKTLPVSRQNRKKLNDLIFKLD